MADLESVTRATRGDVDPSGAENRGLGRAEYTEVGFLE